MKSLLFALLLCVVLFGLFVAAQEADAQTSTEDATVSDETQGSEETQEQTQQQQQQQDDSDENVISSPDCEPSYVFPENDEKKFELGKVQDVLLGFTNVGLKPFKVQYIRGHVASPLDPTYSIQNFTGFYYNVSVAPEETATMLYRFKPDSMLDSREFLIFIDVYYLNDRNDTFITSFFNGTVNFVEPTETFDARSVFSYVSMVGMLALIVFFVYNFLCTGKKSRSSAVSSKNAEDDMDFIDDNIKRQFLGSKKKDE